MSYLDPTHLLILARGGSIHAINPNDPTPEDTVAIIGEYRAPTAPLNALLTSLRLEWLHQPTTIVRNTRRINLTPSNPWAHLHACLRDWIANITPVPTSYNLDHTDISL